MLLNSTKEPRLKMAPRALSLTTFPVEILCDIFRLLDPISLISTSQTKAQFRSIINPSKFHFIERLLALECRVEEGGVRPKFKPSLSPQLDPDLSLPQWESMRWACSGCLHLLPHEAFDNHALLRLAYRKPIPGSSAVNRFTSWEPSLRGFASPSRRGEKSLRRRNKAAFSREAFPSNGPEQLARYKDCGLVSFQDMTYEEFIKLEIADESRILDLEVHDIELVRCGFKRHLRKCLQCRYQDGDFKSMGLKMLGTISVPIVPSRRVLVASPLDRYFPEFSQVFETKRPACDFSNTGAYANTDISLWTMYMVRCSHCSEWKESRALRLGNFFSAWKPYVAIDAGLSVEYRGRELGFRNWDNKVVTEGLINDLLCNHCFEELYGRKMLATVIVQWLRLHLQREKRVIISYRIAGALRDIPQNISELPLKWQERMHRIIQSALEYDHMLQNEEDLSDEQIVSYRECYDRWRGLREETGDDWVQGNFLIDLWVTHFDKFAAQYVWLRDILQEVDLQEPN
ncbi:hypothetical protein N7486_002602 [Penicillium sp. IBT 16267x]|nr:hypothetical protein N7486_002602 [Penicillium sp. IBT 16267x]